MKTLSSPRRMPSMPFGCPDLYTVRREGLISRTFSIAGTDPIEATVCARRAALGVAMGRGGLASRLASGAGRSPGHHARAGGRRLGRTHPGHRNRRRVVVPWAWATRQAAPWVGRTLGRLAAQGGSKQAASIRCNQRSPGSLTGESAEISLVSAMTHLYHSAGKNSRAKRTNSSGFSSWGRCPHCSMTTNSEPGIAC